jgi:subtilisin family serine protease
VIRRRIDKRSAVVLGAVALVCGGVLPVAAASTPDGEDLVVAYDHGSFVRHADHPAPQVRTQRLADRYLVTFDAGTPSETVTAARRDAESAGARTYYKYSKAVQGFAAVLTDAALGQLRRNKHIVGIEPDYSISVSAAPTPEPSTASTKQVEPENWGLDRIDQHALPLDKSYSYERTGEGVTAYVIDTGVRSTHRELTGRVGKGYGVIDDGNGSEDCNGHGTHVAGVLGGTTYGVAKRVKIVSVRVLDCDGSGTISGVVAGVDWVTKNHRSPAVANMSLGGVVSDTLDEAVEASIAAGVHYTVAAGNEGESACSYSPGRIADAIVVGSTDRQDRRSEYSNFGSCVDLFAPGEDILSADGTGDTATQLLSGTSMASPHVAGVVAQYLQKRPNASREEVRAALLQVATPNVLKEIGSGSPNRLLFSLLGTAGLADPALLPPLMELSQDGAVDDGMAEMLVRLEPGASYAGTARHELQRSTDGGATWAPVGLPSALAKLARVSVPPGTVTLRVRAIDAEGNPGPWATSPTRTVALLGQGQATVYDPPSAWADTPVHTAAGRSVIASDHASATATFTFSGTQFAWFSGRSASGGRAAVLIDGKQVAVVDLSALPDAPRRLAYVSDSLAQGRHTVVIRVLSERMGKAAHARGVDIDGWATVS